MKILVFILVSYILLLQLGKISFDDLSRISLSNTWYLVLAVLLVPLNWGLELFKWYITVRSVDSKVRFSKISQSLFAGISTGFVTPNRLGNFIGRMFYFKAKSRSLLILGTLYGNLAQFLASLLFGAVGFYFVGSNVLDMDESTSFAYSALIIGGGAILLYVLSPFLPFENSKRLARRFNVLSMFRIMAKRIALPLFILSSFRYIVFVLQFCLILIAFGAEYSHELIYALYLHYLIITLIPTLIMGKLVVRETIGLLVLSVFIPNAIIIIVSSLTLWLINLGVPAIVGLYFLLKIKTNKDD